MHDLHTTEGLSAHIRPRFRIFLRSNLVFYWFVMTSVHINSKTTSNNQTKNEEEWLFHLLEIRKNGTLLMKLPKCLKWTFGEPFFPFSIAIFLRSLQWQWQYTRDLYVQHINKLGFCCHSSETIREKRLLGASKKRLRQAKWWVQLKINSLTNIQNKRQWKDLWLNFIFQPNDAQLL